MEDDAESTWGFLSSDNGSAISNHQDIVPHGLDSPSITSQGSWGMVVTDAQRQRMYQTPSPELQLDANASSASCADHLPFGDADVPSRRFNNSPRIGFNFPDASMGAQQQNPEGQYTIETLQQAQDFDMTENFLLNGQIPVGYGFHFNMYLQNALINTIDPASHSFTPYGMPTSTNVGTDAPHSLNSAPGHHPFITPAPGPYDPPSGSSIECHPPSSRSSIELGPELPPGWLQPTQNSNTSNGDKMHGTKRKDRPAAAEARRPRKKNSPSPRLSSSDPEPGESPVFEFCNMNPENWSKGDFGSVTGVSRSSQKGRKGALSEDTRANALAVRKAGACFCCQFRKVRCDQQRPCKNCIKFCNRPQMDICWQFEDFTRVLFPPDYRKHFSKEDMSRFVSDNVQSFTLNGIEQPCTVILSSGPDLTSKLVVKARFFTAKVPNADVLQHWFQFLDGTGADHVEFERIRATPIGLLERDRTKSSELRRKIDDYVHNIVQEPTYACQLTDSIRKSTLPRKMLQAVQRYSQHSNSSSSSIVKRALSIYTMHYIQTRHLTLTQQSIEELQWINPVRATGSYMTPRLLNRQLKAVTDDLAVEGVKTLYDEFSKRLRTKDRSDWAPCLAAFLVLCMLMEAMEAAVDRFAIAENEVGTGQGPSAQFERPPALETNKCIEQGPFKKFACQFHQLYQTHSKDPSKSFNPLADNISNELCELESSAALELVQSLRDMLRTDRLELQSLTGVGPITMDADGQDQSRPRNVLKPVTANLASQPPIALGPVDWKIDIMGI
ncbi:hypothetical protein VMCG_00107 [Cytospora schulzeri]|uniref:Zn(2)-C6 fungal-type domain-containing protein n=1 Tax=Cytospora schulzeri TaxID=448051 RepID=A0A423X870_9PEZI|nr:hypothetical protein VMCG_00107 [Valsa malicola]